MENSVDLDQTISENDSVDLDLDQTEREVVQTLNRLLRMENSVPIDNTAYKEWQIV